MHSDGPSSTQPHAQAMMVSTPPGGAPAGTAPACPAPGRDSLEAPPTDRGAQLEQDLARVNEELARERRGREVDRLLFSAHATDPDSARVLVERAMEEGLDAGRAVALVIQRSPALFRQQPPAGATMAPAARAATDIERAQREAEETGDRRALLRYLRLRRQGS